LSDDPTPILALELSGEAPAAAGGAAIRAAAVGHGLPVGRAARLEAVVLQLLIESRTREALSGATGSTIEVHHDDHNLHVVVRDRRLPLSPEEYRRSGTRRLADQRFVDHLEVTADGEAGNVAFCTVSLEADAIHRTASGGHVAVLDEQVDPISDEIAASVVIRPMTAEDTLGVARCVYRCYGYSYLDPTMYRPQQLQRAVDAGVVRSLVAVTGDNEVVGHIAMTFQHVDDVVPEGGKLVVDPRFRGRKLANRLGLARLELARELTIPGIWIECVTNHEFSQREVIALGGAETGFLIAAVPATLEMVALGSASLGRHSLIAMYLRATPSPAAIVHVAERHVEMLGGVSDRLGLDRTFDSSIVAPVEDLTTSVSGLSANNGVAGVRVGAIGKDLLDHLDDRLEAFDSLDLSVVHLDLPVHDPSAVWAAQEAERLGWFIGAWLPCVAPTGDVLRLQRLAGRPVDTDHVVLARKEGEAMREHVLSERHRVTHSAS
jgi:GNAT superfamily N-acetyltransferase